MTGAGRRLAGLHSAGRHLRLRHIALLAQALDLSVLGVGRVKGTLNFRGTGLLQEDINSRSRGRQGPTPFQKVLCQASLGSLVFEILSAATLCLRHETNHKPLPLRDETRRTRALASRCTSGEMHLDPE